ncbi:hypothetical protein YC2023_010447 [Brassica napus]
MAKKRKLLSVEEACVLARRTIYHTTFRDGASAKPSFDLFLLLIWVTSFPPLLRGFVLKSVIVFRTNGHESHLTRSPWFTAFGFTHLAKYQERWKSCLEDGKMRMMNDISEQRTLKCGLIPNNENRSAIGT